LASALPRVNFLGVVAAVLCLVSILLPWWGITTTVLGTTTSTMWGFFGAPGHLSDSNGAQNFSPIITTYSPIILALVLVSMVLAMIGSFIVRHRILAASLATSIAGLVGYAALIGYATRSSCMGQGCITQSTGAFTLPGASVSWGYQTGFYLFAAATILILVGLVFHQSLTRPASAAVGREHKTGFCANCGARLPSDAKFCPSCAHAVTDGKS
jgi:ribosomal protein L40E